MGWWLHSKEMGREMEDYCRWRGEVGLLLTEGCCRWRAAVDDRLLHLGGKERVDGYFKMKWKRDVSCGGEGGGVVEWPAMGEDGRGRPREMGGRR